MRAAALVLLLAFAPLAASAQQTAAQNAPSPAAAAPPPADSEEAEDSAPHIDQSGVSPDGPMSWSGLSYEERIRASVAAAQGLQGPLDGRWILYGADGKQLFTFQLVDPAGGRGPLEGVWRDLRRPAGSGAYGLVDSLRLDGATLVAVFNPHPPLPGVSLNLQALAGGQWSGEMTEDGARMSVTLRRP
jgi:hypothetical protein